MEKEELLELANNLHEEVFSANSYWLIIQQYHEERKEYLAEINLSPAFFHVTYNALIEAMYMKLSKVYNCDKDTLDMYRLINECIQSSDVFPNKREFPFIDTEGNECIHTEPLTHRITVEEEEFFRDQKEILGHIARTKELFRANGLEYKGTDIEFDITELLAFYRKKFAKLNTAKDNLREQRNKVYAHNLRDVNFRFEEIYKQYPIKKDDIDALISFAMEFTQFCISMLSGVVRAEKASNIDDMANILDYARIGKLYQKQYLEDQYFKGK